MGVPDVKVPLLSTNADNALVGIRDGYIDPGRSTLSGVSTGPVSVRRYSSREKVRCTLTRETGLNRTPVDTILIWEGPMSGRGPAGTGRPCGGGPTGVVSTSLP